jgi:uncharacterized Zn finger protein
LSWQDPHGHLGTNLPPPEDGISVSGHALGQVGRRWIKLLNDASADSKDRVLRGRTFAKRGRARALHISPGVAAAEVVAREVFHPSLRVRSFGRGEWGIITRALLKDLDTIASLLEGELPAMFMAKMDTRGAALMPSFDELSFDCDCGDYAMPCAHVATVFHVLSHALDGDPFLLLTLRGRTRDHLLSTLRTTWGDDSAIRAVVHVVEQAPPDTDWFASPNDIPEFACSVAGSVQTAAGLRALGPPPGESDLLAALEPLYARGGSVAHEVIASVPNRVPPKRRVRVAPRPKRVAPPERVERQAPSKKMRSVEPRSTIAPRPQQAPLVDLTEVLVNGLAELDVATTAQLTKMLRLDISVVRRELLELEELGLVYQDRRGDVPGWRLG